MKLTEFIKNITKAFEKYGVVRIGISKHGESVVLEVSVEEEVSTPFDFSLNPNRKFVALIDLDERFGLKESNFANVSEQIRSSVFETVNDFVSTPVNKR